MQGLLKARPDINPNAVKIVEAAGDELGYSGTNITIPTKAGIPAEIQINSAEMIYAKEFPEIARSVLGDSLYTEIASRPGLPPGGLGHQLYESWRSLPKGSLERDAIAAQSRAYYDLFRR